MGASLDDVKLDPCATCEYRLSFPHPRLLKSVSHDSKAAKKAMMAADSAAGSGNGSLESLLQTVPAALRQIEFEMCDAETGKPKGKPSLWSSLLSFLFGATNASALQTALERGCVAAQRRKSALETAKLLTETLKQVLVELRQSMFERLIRTFLRGAGVRSRVYHGYRCA